MKICRRISRPGGGPALRRGNRRHHDALLGNYGDLRRPDPFDRTPRHRSDAPERRHPASRARLPGLRHARWDGGRRNRDRQPSGSDFLLIRRHAAGAGRKRQPVVRESTRCRYTHGLFAPRCPRRCTQSAGSGGRVLRRRLRNHCTGHRHDGAAGGTTKALRTFPCSCPMSSYRRQLRLFCARPTTACRAFSRQGTSAR